MVNKLKKKCFNCGVDVLVGTGFSIREENLWKTFCTTCCPQKKTEVRSEITEDGEVYFPYNKDAVTLVRSLPMARWNPAKKCWNVSLAVEHIKRVVDVCSNLGIKIPQTIIEQNDKAITSAIEKVENVVMRESSTGKQLMPYQIDGTIFLSSKKRAILGDEMGTGKTIQTLCALDNKVGTLVICPASLKYNWRKECQEWRPEIKVFLCEGRGSFVLPKSGEMVIANYDILPDDISSWSFPEFNLVCDEVHVCKSYKSKRHKSVKHLASKASKVFGLTGTPMMNRPFDLFGVLSCLSLEKEVFGSFNGFLRSFNASKSRWGGYVFGGVNPDVPEKLRRVMLRRRREEVLPFLPKKNYTTIEVNGLSKELKSQLDTLSQDWLDLVEVGDLPPFESFAAIRASLATSRIPAMLEMVEDHEEEGIPLVVFSAHREPIEALKDREGWEIIVGKVPPKKRHEIVEKFQNGELKGVALTIQAGGVGLTLTHAWKALFVDLDWTPALNSQAEDRICRLGQTKPCEIVRLVSNHVLDKHITKLLTSKIELFQNAIDNSIEIKNLLQSVPGETDEEYQLRMAKAYELAQNKMDEKTLSQNPKLLGLTRVKHILEAERGRSGGKIIEPKITPKLEQQIVEGLEKMLQVCDGAMAKDFQGFNKPDAQRSRYLYMAGLDEPESLLAAYYMLKRYPRQMANLLD